MDKEINSEKIAQFMQLECDAIMGPDGAGYTEEPVSVYMLAIHRIRKLEAKLAAARAEGYAQGVREAAHLMPKRFGVWSRTGCHIGVWDDRKIAASIFSQYPGGVMRDLIDMTDILALLDTDTPTPDLSPQIVTYTNWRGETDIRKIIPQSVWHGSTEWHPEKQWFIRAIDADKQAIRDFALADFGKNTPAPPLPDA
jgi:hypothetical protein